MGQIDLHCLFLSFCMHPLELWIMHPHIKQTRGSFSFYTGVQYFSPLIVIVRPRAIDFVRFIRTFIQRVQPHSTSSSSTYISLTSPIDAPILCPQILFIPLRGILCNYNHKDAWSNFIKFGSVKASKHSITKKLLSNS